MQQHQQQRLRAALRETAAAHSGTINQHVHQSITNQDTRSRQPWSTAVLAAVKTGGTKKNKTAPAFPRRRGQVSTNPIGGPQ